MTCSQKNKEKKKVKKVNNFKKCNNNEFNLK